MAWRAVVTQLALHMIGVFLLLKIILMAGPAVGRLPQVAVDMTLRAVRCLMSASQRKGGQIVIKLRRRPALFSVALNAALRKLRGHMIRILCAIKIIFMTAKAFSR